MSTPAAADIHVAIDANACFICTESLEICSFGHCNHPVCYVCAMRLRAVYQNSLCPYCKAELTDLVITRAPGKKFKEFSPAELKFRSIAYHISFTEKELYEKTIALTHHQCPDEGCEYVAEKSGGSGAGKGYTSLKHHVRTAHSKMLCATCVAERKCFPFEQRLYTRKQLSEHYADPKDGHPKCKFCQTVFYDADQLFLHCREQHEQCHICMSNGRRDQYYRNYEMLEQHFASEHFLCCHPTCLQKKFVVFANDLDLKAHVLNEHRDTIIGQRAARRLAHQITANFHFPSVQSSSSMDNVGKGRARDAVTTPTHVDRRSGNNPTATLRSRAPAGFGALSAPSLSSAKTTAQTLPPPENQMNFLDEEEWPSIVPARSHSAASFASNGIPSSSSQTGIDSVFADWRGIKIKVKKKPQTAASTDPIQAQPPPLQLRPPPPAAAGGELNSGRKHMALLAEVEKMLHDAGNKDDVDQQVNVFRTRTAQYRSGRLAAPQYLEFLSKLLGAKSTNTDTLNQMVFRVADLLDSSDHQNRLIKALHDRLKSYDQFPKLGKASSNGSPPSADRTPAEVAGDEQAHRQQQTRVLVIRSNPASAAQKRKSKKALGCDGGAARGSVA